MRRSGDLRRNVLRPRGLRSLLVLASAIVAGTAAAAGNDWDGTWHGGFDNGGDGVQLIMVGEKVTGFYFHGDYLDTDDGVAMKDGSITFHWEGGEGVLTDNGGAHKLTIHEGGKADQTIALARDE